MTLSETPMCCAEAVQMTLRRCCDMMHMFPNGSKECIMLKATRLEINSWGKRLRLVAVCLLAMVLPACQNAATPAPSLLSTPMPSAFMSLDELLKSVVPPQGDVTTVGYLV